MTAKTPEPAAPADANDLIGFILINWRQLAPSFFYGLGRVLVVAPFPFFFQIIIDEYVKSGNVAGIGSICIMIVGLLILHAVLAIKGSMISAAEISRIILQLRGRVFQKLQFLHFGYLDGQQTGRLLSKYAFDTQKVEMALLPLIQSFMPEILYSLCIIIMLSILNWQLSVVILFFVPIYAFCRGYFFIRIQRKNHEMRLAQERLTGTANEYITALRLVRGYGQERTAMDTLNESSQTYARSRTDQITMNNSFGVFSFISTQLITLTVVAGGALLVVYNHVSLGTLFAFMAGLPIILAPVNSFINISTQYFMGKESFLSLKELLDSTYVEEWKGSRKLPGFRGDIRFDKVSFRYKPELPDAIAGIDLHIAAGEHVALVGPSGSGKSTIANLILGLYNPREGSILIDEVPQAQINMRWLRRQCAIVMQESLLLSGSVLDNIRFARPEATEAEVVEAARQANAEEFIMRMSDGFYTRVGERGASLSGGQRQRISIARAILRNPRILIMDEATSALDYESERLIQEAMERLASGRTVITIAHRLSTVKSADRIVVLAGGKIVQMGDYHTLSEQPGYFHELLSAQA